MALNFSLPKYYILYPICFCSIFYILFSSQALATDINVKVSDILPQATLMLAPRSADIIEGSVFNLQILLDTHGKSVNTVDVELSFPANKLNIIKPAGNKSLISVWVVPPTFSNTTGRAHFSGVITNGIVTNNGLIAEITFRAVSSGEAVAKILSSSQILANDGLGSPFVVEYGRGTYTISPQPPEGVRVFSESHQFTSNWYNNNNIILGWEGGTNFSDYSLALDNKPFTVPDDISDIKDDAISFSGVADGVWYFHVKARRNGVWGATTHFPIHIDTTPPASFKPRAEILAAELISRVLLSFFTTDALSGLDHYEVGVIDKERPPSETPVFIQTDSPYQLPQEISRNVRVVVRAIDRAGNVRDESVDIHVPSSLFLYIENNLVVVLVLLIAAALLALILHYLVGHRILARIKRAIALIEKG